MFYVDDRFHSSDPVLRIPREQRVAAVGLWTLAGTWSRHFLKDGFVPGHMIEELGGSAALADLLVEVKLWRRKGGGYQFNDWATWQDTRETIEKKRAEWRARQNKTRGSKAETSGDVTHDVTRDSPTPLPSPYPLTTETDRGRQSSHSEPTTDDSSTHGDNSGDYPAVLAAAAARLSTLNGSEISIAQTGPVVDMILDRGGKRVRNPRHYVLGVLRDHGHEWLNFIHTGKEPE